MAPRKRTSDPPAESAEPTFDERLERLEGLVAELESGQLGLEPAIERYQAGVELLKQCQELLRGYRKRVEELSADAEQALRPYPGDPDAGGEDG